jgi:hypothetical protein
MNHAGRSASVPVGSQKLERQADEDRGLPVSHSAEASNQPPEHVAPALRVAPVTYKPAPKWCVTCGWRHTMPCGRDDCPLEG